MVADIDIAERAQAAEQADVEDSRPVAPESASTTWWLQKLAPARLTSRIILINFVGLVILVGGILYSNQSRQSLIDARVQSLMTQGHIMAAAIASAASVDTDQIIIDPDAIAARRCTPVVVSSETPFQSLTMVWKIPGCLTLMSARRSLMTCSSSLSPGLSCHLEPFSIS